MYFSYLGPLGGQGHNKKVKVDISKNEVMVFQPLLKTVIPLYSDSIEHEILCYTLEEILLEKMRSVIQRMQARDLFDLWYLVEVQMMEPDLYKNEFLTKCRAKGIEPSTFSEKLKERLPQYKSRWQGSLKEQIKYLPDFEMVERELLRHFKKLSQQ